MAHHELGNSSWHSGAAHADGSASRGGNLPARSPCRLVCSATCGPSHSKFTQQQPLAGRCTQEHMPEPAAARARPRQQQEMPQHCCAPATRYEVELQAIEDYRHFAATTIQRVFRGWIVRLRRAREASLRQQQKAAAASQGAAAARLNRAARCIQDAWRCFRNKRVFALFKATIAFREGCDPRQVLRCISAREAQLVEPAAGLHVRLRLAGPGFPPVLVYKLFTHRPVTDICAFGPRDYAAEAAAKRAAATGAGAGAAAAASTNSSCSKRGWYRRQDKNGWRPVVELQQMPGEPPLPPFSCPSGSGGARHKPVALHRSSKLSSSSHGCRVKKRHCRRASAAGSGNSCSETAPPAGQQQRDGGAMESQGDSDNTFHHSPLVRRAERARRMKQRRRQWLLKMYRVGMQQQQDEAAPAAVSSSSSSSSGTLADKSSSSPASREELLLQRLARQLLRQQQRRQPPLDASSSSSSTAVVQEGDVSDLEMVSLGLDANILAWAHRLDFEAWYQAHWAVTAVTLGSEAAVPVPLNEQLLQAARLAR